MRVVGSGVWEFKAGWWEPRKPAPPVTIILFIMGIFMVFERLRPGRAVVLEQWESILADLALGSPAWSFEWQNVKAKVW